MALKRPRDDVPGLILESSVGCFTCGLDADACERSALLSEVRDDCGESRLQVVRVDASTQVLYMWLSRRVRARADPAVLMEVLQVRVGTNHAQHRFKMLVHVHRVANSLQHPQACVPDIRKQAHVGV